MLHNIAHAGQTGSLDVLGTERDHRGLAGQVCPLLREPVTSMVAISVGERLLLCEASAFWFYAQAAGATNE